MRGRWGARIGALACVVVTPDQYCAGPRGDLGAEPLPGTSTSDLWWLAVLVCFATQRQAPAISDALTEAIPAWIRRKLGGDKAAGGDAP